MQPVHFSISSLTSVKKKNSEIHDLVLSFFIKLFLRENFYVIT